MNFSSVLTMPEFWTFAGGALGFLLAMMSVGLRLLGVGLPPPMMTRLHSAIMSVARAAVKRRLSPAETAELLLEHLTSSVPDTLAKLAPPPNVLATHLEGYIGEAAAAQGVRDAPALLGNVAAEVERVMAGVVRMSGARPPGEVSADVGLAKPRPKR